MSISLHLVDMEWSYNHGPAHHEITVQNMMKERFSAETLEGCMDEILAQCPDTKINYNADTDLVETETKFGNRFWWSVSES